MSPARRSRKRMQSENQISIRKEKRIPLTEEMKIFLRHSPLILMPNLNQNIKEIPKTSLYTSKNYIGSKKPQVQKKLPQSKANTSGEKNEESAGGDRGQVNNALSNKQQAAGSSVKLSVSPESPIQEKCDQPGPSSPSISGDAKHRSKSPGSPMKGKDVRDSNDDSKKAVFLSALNLVQRTTARRVQVVKETELPFQLRNKLRARRGQIVSYFKSNPLPVSSTLGRKIIRSGLGQCQNPADEVTRYDKYCTPHKQRNLPGGVTHWPVVNTRRAGLKPGQYCHKYSFGNRQRVTRSVELTLGVSAKSFPLLNKCRDFSIHVQRMSDQDVARAMYSLQNPPQVQDCGKATPESSRPVRRWIASEPTAGPSRDIERIAEPVVMLDDISLSPKYARFFS